MERKMLKSLLIGALVIIAAVALFKFMKIYGIKTGSWSNDDDQHVGSYRNWAEHNRD